MKRYIILFGLITLILVTPFILRKEEEKAGDPDEVLVIISPHLGSIRYEFTQGFKKWYKKTTGLKVDIDWRTPGGTSEIVRFINSEYTNSFRNYWEKELNRKWSLEVQENFTNYYLDNKDLPNEDSLAQLARRSFLESSVSCGIDIFFGGGSYDFIQQSRAGRLIDCGLLKRYPEWFGNAGIPQTFAGEPFWDGEGRWIGAVLATFGIIYNRDSHERLGIENLPIDWSDLTDPRYAGEIAVADPTKSGSVNKAFEMILQQQMQNLHSKYKEENSLVSEDLETRAIHDGWLKGMQLIQQIAANARYFTDSATKISIDVSNGDCAAGMSIDFYGRYQAELIRNRGQSDRFGYIMPKNGSAVSVDPIGIFRGAKNAELAREFITYVLSIEGQKLWNFKVNTPGGPEQYALRRPPVRKELYVDDFKPFRSDPDVNPYLEAGDFVYEGKWTGPLFNELRFIIKVAFIDVHKELKAAWAALIDNNFPAEALAMFSDLSAIDYEESRGSIKKAVRSRNQIEEVIMAKKLSNHFRKKYKDTVRLAYGDL